MRLRTIGTFGLGKSKVGGPSETCVVLNVAQGSVIDFKAPSSQNASRVGAIVNAANEGCLGGGGVDGAMNNAGGPMLWEDREALPLVSKKYDIRCHTGGAVVTGPNRYGILDVNYVIHAVGPAYFRYEDDSDTDDDAGNEFAKPDALLRSAYQESLERCQDNGITDVAFSLLSAGVFRGRRSLIDVLLTGVLAIRDWVAEEEKKQSTSSRLQTITLCGFSKKEVVALIKVCRFVFETTEEEECKREKERPNNISS